MDTPFRALVRSAETSSSTSLAVRAPGDVGHLQDRDRINIFLTESSAAALAIAAAVAACSPITALNAAAAVGCGLVAYAGVALTILASRVIRASFQRPATAQNARRSIDGYNDSLHEVMFGTLDAMTTSELAEGATVTIRKSANLSKREVEDENDFSLDLDWHQHNSDEITTVHMDFSGATNHTVLSSKIPSEFMGRYARGLNKRLEDYTLYWSHADGVLDAKNEVADNHANQDNADRIGVEAWRYMRNNEVGSACASVQLDGGSVHRGYIALIQGQFTDFSPQCPM